jgi:hypothetical protein
MARFGLVGKHIVIWLIWLIWLICLCLHINTNMTHVDSSLHSYAKPVLVTIVYTDLRLALLKGAVCHDAVCHDRLGHQVAQTCIDLAWLPTCQLDQLATTNLCLVNQSFAYLVFQARTDPTDPTNHLVGHYFVAIPNAKYSFLTRLVANSLATLTHLAHLVGQLFGLFG